jgi:SAM-dependent methyltransferase
MRGDSLSTVVPQGDDYRGDELVATAYARGYNRWIMQFLRAHLGRVIVEVGAGTGSYTRELLTTAPQRMIAIEPSGYLFPQLERRLGNQQGVELHHATLPGVADRLLGEANSVVYVNVLEHIADDASEIKQAARVLKPGGSLCIFVPALPWLSSRFDREVGHHRRYSRDQLVRLVETNGLRVVDARYFDMLGIAIWFVAMRLMGMRMGAGRVRTYDTLIVPAARVLDKLFGPPIGKSLIVIAKRDQP